MTTLETAPNRLRQAPDFSLVLGGPLFQLWRRAGVSTDALELLHRRVIVISLLCWLPLLLLSTLEGRLIGASAAVPFLLDLELHAKLLLVIPLLVWAELVMHRQMRFVADEFLQRQLIPDNAMARFDAAIAAAFRLRNSARAEALLLALVYVVGVLVIWRHFTALDAFTWYATPSAAGSQLSFAGMWYAYVSLPMFQFLLLRWYFRLFVWARFLWQVSRIDLRLIPSHPDRAGGLGFLSLTVYAFLPLALAHGVLVAGQIANRIFHFGAALPDFKAEISMTVVLLLCLVLGPMLMFSSQLWQAQLKGRREYGILAHRYVREFEAKWLRGGAPADEALVGSADLQSLADLAGSVEIVDGMRSTPISNVAIAQVVAATLVPILPLLLTMMPLEELLKKLLGVFF